MTLRYTYFSTDYKRKAIGGLEERVSREKSRQFSQHKAKVNEITKRGGKPLDERYQFFHRETSIVQDALERAWFDDRPA
jgi:hypothetical protein